MAGLRLAVNRGRARRLRLCFVVESGTDVRMVEGLAERFDLKILARKIVGGVEISHPPGEPVPTFVGPASRLGFALHVLRYLRQHRNRIDYVIVQGYGPAALAANVASRLAGKPIAMLVCSATEVYYRCRENVPDGQFRLMEWAALRLLARTNAAVGRRYLVLSRYLAEVVKSHGARQVDIVPVYGVDTTAFVPPREPKQAIRARLGLPTTGALLFFSSRMAPEKDSATLLAAMRSLVEAGRDLLLLHRSGGYQSLLEQARRFSIAPRVIATDAVHPLRQLPRDYQAADLCVQSSRAEGLGFSPLEALACGLPVIATAVGGLKETIVDGYSGWTYPVGDSDALARCIADVLDHPAEAARRAAIGRQLVCERYDRRAAFDQLERVITMSMRSHGPASE